MWQTWMHMFIVTICQQMCLILSKSVYYDNALKVEVKCLEAEAYFEFGDERGQCRFQGEAEAASKLSLWTLSNFVSVIPS